MGGQLCSRITFGTLCAANQLGMPQIRQVVGALGVVAFR